MQVRILFYCPRCGSGLFRPSISQRFGDVFLRTVGIRPHRCYMCHLRFYLFKPVRLRAFVAALDRPLVTGPAPERRPASSTMEVSRTSMVAGTRNLFR